jgi:RNA polymerase sigma-70 factor (ECF subfamily)
MDLLARFAAGDREAFEALFRRGQADVYRWIVRIVRDRAAAEDLTVETFWRIYRARARFEPTGNFNGWARRIATNVAIDYLRSARPEVGLLDDVAASPESDPVEQHDLSRAIRGAFARLPPRLRVAATLALIEEQPYADIAAALDISVPAVKSRVFRAMRVLRRRLERQGVKV